MINNDIVLTNICLIIVNYNGIDYLKKYLGEIDVCCKSNCIKLIITDDQSTDDSIEFLKQGGYDFTINKSNNHGFAANVNNGIKFAKEYDDFDYFIIANNDIKINIELFEFSLPKVISNLELNANKLGLIGFREILWEEASFFYNYNFRSYNVNFITEVEYIPGFFFIISNNLINKIGLMDEEYYMYGEDNDYFARTKKANFKIFDTGIPILHFSEGSSTNRIKTSWFVYRNALLYAQKNEGIFGVIRMILAFLVKIYNPFYTSNIPSNQRIVRSGFLMNNYLLVKSVLWNLKYFFMNKIK
jgi:GT2 family glycosyltransferase